jgi:hypothetical protein
MYVHLSGYNNLYLSTVWEANSHSSTQENPTFHGTLKFIVPYPETDISTHTSLPPLFFKFSFNIIYLQFCKVSCTFWFSDGNSVYISSLFRVCYMPCPSHSWYRLGYLLNTQHWSPDYSCTCCCFYTKFQSKNRGLTKGQNFREWMQAAINVTCQSYLVHSKRIHNQFQIITKYRTSCFIFHWI